MGKPDWLKDKERAREERRRFKLCISCKYAGQPIGETNYVPKEGRKTLYQCNLHPTKTLYNGQFACEDHEYRK